MAQFGSLFYPSVDFMSVFVDNIVEIPWSCLLLFFKEEFMKIIYKVFALIAVIAFVGCATTGGNAGGSKSKLSEADLQRMGITHGGYGNSN